VHAPPPPPRRLRPGQMRRDLWVEAHTTASVRLRGIDSELEQVLERRVRCLDELTDLRARLNRRWSHHHVRRHARVDEPPMPPARPEARALEGIDLRAVCVTLLRRHGPLELRALHGLLHQYGYTVGGVRPVQRLGDAMAYEARCGRLRRVRRGTYAAEGAAPPPPRQRWDGPAPEPGSPLPWSRPVTEPGPPLVDPPVAHDPQHWSQGAWPAPPCTGGPDAPGGDDRPEDRAAGAEGQPAGAVAELRGGVEPDATGAPADAGDPAPDTTPPAPVGDDSSTNRPRATDVGSTGVGREGPSGPARRARRRRSRRRSRRGARPRAGRRARRRSGRRRR